MVRVSIEVYDGAARFSVAVQAESIRRAVSIMGSRYPNSDVRVRFPIDPERFFVKDPTARAGLTEHGPEKRLAA